MGTLVSKTQPDLIGDEDDIQSWSSVSYRSNYQHYMPVELDPRSPTAGIERTPIQLPIQSAASLDPAGNIGRTPIATQTTSYQVSMLLDPRSPTIGIERTPIQVQLLKSPAALQDPRSPTVGIDRTPIICLASQSECTGENTAIPSDVQLTDAPATEESTAMDIIPFDLNSADADNSESTVDVAGTLTATMSTMNDNDCVFSKPVSQAVVKSKPLQDSNTVHASSGGRSPLASINYALSGRSKSDTPRGIVQRKQALRFEKMRNDANSPSIGSRQGQFPVYCDKENDF